MTESMGMSLTGCAAIPAVDAAKLRIARESGEAVVTLVKKNVTPREIVTKKSLENAIRVDMALGGSTNTVLHLMAIATEAEIPLSLADFNRIAEEIPHICYMLPAGPYSMQALYRARGIPAVLKRLEKHLADCPDRFRHNHSPDCARCGDKKRRGYQGPRCTGSPAGVSGSSSGHLRPMERSSNPQPCQKRCGNIPVLPGSLMARNRQWPRFSHVRSRKETS